MVSMSIGLLLLVPVWFFAGMGPAGRSCLPWLIAVTWAGLTVTGRLRSMRNDRLLWAWLALCGYLCVRYLNAGVELRLYLATRAITETPPLMRWFPTAYNVEQAYKVFLWFFAGGTCLLAARYGISADVRGRLMRAIVYNGLIVLIVGAVVRLSGTNRVMWVFRNGGEPFWGPFGYINAFADYCLICGLLAWFIGGRWRWAVLPFGGGVYVSGCIAVQAMYALFVALAGIYLWANSARYKYDPIWLPAGLSLAVLIGGLAYEARGEIVSELWTERAWQVSGAYRIWQCNVWTGKGPGAYQTIAPFFTEPQHLWRLRERGRANVHNDYMQYLMELGIIGLVLIAIVASTACSHTARHQLWALLPVLAMGIHALIDIPFRCPVTIIATAFLAGFPKDITTNKEDTCGRLGYC